MTIHPRQFDSLPAFAEAMVREAYSMADQPQEGDDAATQARKRADRMAATEAAEEAAFDRWSDYVENAANLYEQGVGPAWEC